MFKSAPLKDHVAAISCGIPAKRRCSTSTMWRIRAPHTDANFVMTGTGGIVEIQGTAEGEPFAEERFHELLALGAQGHRRAGRAAERPRSHEGEGHPRNRALCRGSGSGKAVLRDDPWARVLSSGRAAIVLPLRRPGAADFQSAQADRSRGHRTRRTAGAWRHGPGHVCFRAEAAELDGWRRQLEAAGHRDRGRFRMAGAAGARSMCAIRPAIRSNSPSRASGVCRARGAASSGQGWSSPPTIRGKMQRDQRSAAAIWRRYCYGLRPRPAGAGGDRNDIRGQCAAQGGSRGKGVQACRPSRTIRASVSMR